MPELYILMFFMIAAAIIAVEIRDLLSAVIAVGVVGLALSVAFLIMKAPALAITQLVVEIICLVILIRATVTRERIEARGAKAAVIGLLTVVLLGVILLFAVGPLGELPVFGEPLMRVSDWYVEQGRQHRGAVNLVSSILLDYRAYDTLGEATVLFVAVIGVMAVMRRIGRKKQGGSDGGSYEG